MRRLLYRTSHAGRVRPQVFWRRTTMRRRSVRPLTLFLIALLCAPTQLRAQESSAPANFNGFDGFVEQVMKDWKVPGLAVALVKDGKVIYAKGFGYRDVQKGLKVTPDTLFAIGSCSKAFTATAMAILADEGKLDWDKPARNYLPDLMLHDGYATEHIRPRDLVTHQSGLPRHDMVWYGSTLSSREIFERLRHLEPSQPLHAKFQYNNLMFLTAGVLIERISGATWEDFVWPADRLGEGAGRNAHAADCGGRRSEVRRVLLFELCDGLGRDFLPRTSGAVARENARDV